MVFIFVFKDLSQTMVTSKKSSLCTWCTSFLILRTNLWGRSYPLKHQQKLQEVPFSLGLEAIWLFAVLYFHIARMWRNWNPHTLLVGMKCTVTVGSGLAVPQKLHRVTLWPRNSTPRYIPKNLYMNVYSSIILNSQKGEITQKNIIW